MKKKTTVSAIGITGVIIAGIVCFSPPMKRTNWIRKKNIYLKAFDPSEAQLKHFQNDIGENLEILDPPEPIPYAMHNAADVIFLKFEDGDWVCIAHHDSHTDGSELGRPYGFSQKPIGDIAIFIDSSGDMYHTSKHLCGHLITDCVFRNGQLRDLDHFMQISDGEWKKK